MTISENVGKLFGELGNVKLVAATKKKTIDEINEAVSAGISAIGENYVQEAERKFENIRGKCEFHLIGHLQRNKVKKAVRIFDCIQTVDSVDIAAEIDKRCAEINRKMDVMIEVNIGREENKNGCMQEDAEKLADAIVELPNLKLVGLMAMAPFSEDDKSVRSYFRQMKQLFDSLHKKYGLKWLSMGMSHSYKAAIGEGANMVRIGSGIFGERE